MIDTEMVVLLGLLALLAIGIILMFVPFEREREESGLVLREIEPRVGEDEQLIDFRYSVRQIVTPSEKDASEHERASRDKRSPPVPEHEEGRIADEPPECPGDELFYLAATDEVDGDQRQPGLWAKVMALNAGDERKARFHYIRLRVAQIIRNQPAPDPHEGSATVSEVAVDPSEGESGPGRDGETVAVIETTAEVQAIADNLVKNEEIFRARDTHRAEKFVQTKTSPGLKEVNSAERVPTLKEFVVTDVASRLQRSHDAPAVLRVRKVAEAKAVVRSKAIGEAKQIGRARPLAEADGAVGANELATILNHELVSDVIRESKAIGRLIRSANLLRDFSVCQYVTSAHIRKEISVKAEKGIEAPAFFDDYHHRISVSLGDSLQRFDPGVRRSYLISRQFPHQIQLDFFDEALVITVLPGTPQMEFLVLMPGSGLDDPFMAPFLASSRITELFMAAASENENPLSLYIELDLLLERLRIG